MIYIFSKYCSTTISIFSKTLKKPLCKSSACFLLSTGTQLSRKILSPMNKIIYKNKLHPTVGFIL